MTETERKRARDAERTRQAILDAAAEAVARHGTGTTVNDIAEAAQVSKSGLLHHFGSRNELLRALASEQIDKFRAAVLGRLDLSENHPGKLLRAYIRELCDPDSTTKYSAMNSVWSALSDVPGMAELVEADNIRWRSEFAADGLDETRISIARYAAEGIAIAMTYDEDARHDAATTLALILSVTAGDGPFEPT